MGGGIARLGFAGVSAALLVFSVSSIGGATAAPSCVGTPSISADETKVYGSPCGDRIVVVSPRVREVRSGDGNDVIFVNSNVKTVDGGAGDDVIYGELPQSTTTTGVSAPTYFRARRPRSADRGDAVATISKECSAGVSCYGGDGSQELIGSSGNDKIFGQRGNDLIKGEGGNDQLFGGVGDECPSECGSVGIAGGAGSDLLSGGLGTDHLNGNQDSDVIRGDGTIDTLADSGASGTDTLSFATGVAPGFHGSTPVTNFPADADSEERGVYLRLDGVAGLCGTDQAGEPLEACNNDARYGGGADHITISATGFEDVIGSPFADVIAGSSGANRIFGGGGADALYGLGGDDELYGGADGDYLKGEGGTDKAWGEGGADNCIEFETEDSCTGTAESVQQRDRTKISVGFMVTSPPGTLLWTPLYVTGSTGADKVTASYTASAVTFSTEAGSAEFDTSAAAGCTYTSGTSVTCNLSKSLDAITVAGMSGDDVLTLSGFPELTSPVLLGGEGNDTLTAGNGTEDMLVDGNGGGNDVLRSNNYDDALINNDGDDVLEAGLGNDLLLSATNCEGDTLDGAKFNEGDGAAVNSTSWAKMATGQVVADLASGTAGDSYSGGPACSSGALGQLLRIDDLEGSSGADLLYGDGAGNNLLGRLGVDQIWGREGADRIEAKDGIAEVGGGGSGTDSCVLDAGDSFGSCNP